VPRVHCSASETEDNFIGVLAGSSSDDELAAVEVTCDAGSVSYSLRADTDDQAGLGGVFVSPGDRIIVSESVTPTQSFALAVDRTTGDSVSAGGAGPTELGSLGVQIGLLATESGPGHQVPRFHSIAFRYTQVNGEHLAQLSPSAHDESEPPSPRHLVITSPLASPFTQRFTLTFRRSS
jgi:hypothetical protein